VPLANDRSPVSGPDITASTIEREHGTFEDRWAAWRAKGIAHDRAVRRKMAIAAPLVLVAGALVMFAVLAR
jgi:hypothetical protein